MSVESLLVKVEPLSADVSKPITFGAVFSAADAPVHFGILWERIAVVNRPGVPLVVDNDCPLGRIYFITPHAF